VEVKILKVSRNELELEVKGETYTFLNLLQKTLLEDKRVEAAGGKLQHRLLEAANFHLKVKGGKTAFDILFEALNRIKDETAEFGEAFKRAVKEYEGKGKA
jgi:DNA-directed RNA polymerase subunit L